MVMGNYKNLHVFNFAILLESQKCKEFDAREIYVFYSITLSESNCTSVQSSIFWADLAARWPYCQTTGKT